MFERPSHIRRSCRGAWWPSYRMDEERRSAVRDRRLYRGQKEGERRSQTASRAGDEDFEVDGAAYWASGFGEDCRNTCLDYGNS